MTAEEKTLDPCGCCEGITSLTPQSLANRPGLSALVYRVGTHGSFKASMKAAISSRKTLHQLTARDDNDPSIALLDAAATMLDVLTFYQERIANEGFLITATERRSVLELARQIGYELGPGVAASTYLAFELETAPGAPGEATIPVGTRAQSLPGQDELPQIFETVEELEARAEWNRLRPQTTIREIPGFGAKEVYLEGITTGLRPGDGLLMIGAERAGDVGSERWDFRRVKTVSPDPDAGFTRVTWEEGLGWQIFSRKVLPAAKDFEVMALRQRAFLFGYNAPDWRTLPKEIRDRYDASSSNTATEWKNLNLAYISGTKPDGSIDTLYLDALYSEIVPGSWMVLSAPDYQEVYEVASAIEASRKDFTLTAKTTALELKGENLKDEFNNAVRETVVFAKSESLEIAERPITDPVAGDTVVLDRLTLGLEVGRMVIFSGRRMRVQVTGTANLQLVSPDGTQTASASPGDSLIVAKAPETLTTGQMRWTLIDKNKFTGMVTVGAGKLEYTPSEDSDPTASEVAEIEAIDADSDPTVIELKSKLTNIFDRDTLIIYGNVAKATHGETKTEVLGSGDASQPFQTFTLKQSPLTYVSVPTPSGSETTLKVRVDDILWQEASSLYALKERQRAYITRRDDDGKVTIQFGDGRSGARVPTGSENVRAVYRVGTGAAGNVKAGQLSLLLGRVLGVQSVKNPVAASGAADPETRDKARENAPFTVKTLGRIVSLKDFEDLARVFAGIGKAQATWLWDGEARVVHLTVAADTSNGVDYTIQTDPPSDLYKNLVDGINAARDVTQRVQIDSYTPLFFRLEARLLVDRRYLPDKVLEAATDALEQAYSFERRQFGQPVHRSDILAIMQRIEGVEAAYLDKLYFRTAVPDLVTPLPAGRARRENGTIRPAELLLLDRDGAKLTEIKR